MKRRDLISKLEEMGCIFVRHGGKHDWYQNPIDISEKECRDAKFRVSTRISGNA